MKKILLLLSAALMTLAGCGDSMTINAPQNHWKYGTAEVAVTRCELISYGDAAINGTYCYEFRLCSGSYDSFTDTGEGDFLYFKLGVPAEELADGVYYLNGSDPKGSLTEAGYTDRTTTAMVPFTTGNIEIKKSGEKYNITFSLRDGGGIVASGYYDGAFAVSDQTPEPGVPLEVSTIRCAAEKEAELSALDEVALILNNSQQYDLADPYIVLATGKFENGSFSITLPASIDPSHLIDSRDVWSNPALTFSLSGPGTLRQSADARLYGYSSGEKKEEFSMYDPQGQYLTQSFEYIYFDGNITIEGTYADDGVINIFDLSCVKGWNIVHYYCEFSDGSICLHITTDIPQTTWQYASGGY